MPPSASSRENILDNIKTTLAAIVTGDDFNYTPAQVTLGLKRHTEVEDFPAYFIAGADEERKNNTNTQFVSDLVVSIVGYVKATDNADPVELERQISRAIADVTKKLYQDISRGGYAVTTEIVTVDTDKGAYVPVGAFEIAVRCQYRAASATP